MFSDDKINAIANKLYGMAVGEGSGGTLYANGDDFTPERPTYIVTGCIPGLKANTSQLRNPGYGELVREGLRSLVRAAVKYGSTTLGFWHDRTTDTTHFDAGDFYDVESRSIVQIAQTARENGELAIGLYVGGKYATDLYL